MPIAIPTSVLATVQSNPKSPVVGDFFMGLLAERGIPPETSPADYPAEVFEVFRELNGTQPHPSVATLKCRFVRLIPIDY